MTTASINYPGTTTLTITLASLASDTNLVAGRASTFVDNSSNLDIDHLLGGFITTGTTPTTARQIEVWVAPSVNGGSSNFAGGATGSDANLTPQEKTLMKLLTIIPTNGTSNQQYNFGPFSIANACGGTMPQFYAIYFVQNTAAALNATPANQAVTAQRVKYTSA